MCVHTQTHITVEIFFSFSYLRREIRDDDNFGKFVLGNLRCFQEDEGAEREAGRDE